ncbi:DUF2786 domain-containing protein [Nonomuraea endophytica]|uniref:DUF2786 domain-containing protein n=1 Tax=Nonomuraea endophytica TaxID=714136 RepID=A0A7W8A9U9_9ACTN|nr:DUF2786 domain-containing protein [Nonomuraea endophytica]MBB5081290.1 hypothetical protein [Nonomuraea endophytica]
MTDVPDKMLKRIQGLLAKAQATNFEAEADTYMAAALKLMAKYGVEMAHLADSGQVADEVTTFEVLIGTSYGVDRRALLVNIARAKRCRPVYRQMPNGYLVTIVGHASDLEQVKLLNASLQLQMGKGARTARDSSGKSSTGFRKGWMLGFYTRVYERMMDAERAATSEPRPADTASATGRSTELVLASREQAVQASFEKRYPKLGKAPKRTLTNASGYSAGRAAGDPGRHRRQ